MSTGRKRVAAVLAIDMVGYSSRAEEDAGSAADAVGELHERVRAVAAVHDGRVFSTAGDGLMCEFAAASEAIAAARDILSAAPATAPATRVGVHMGEVYEQESGDLLGHGVNVAARLEQMAPPGSALISRAAAETVQGDLRAHLIPRGRVALDKMNETIDVCVLDPAAKAGHARSPRRRRAWLAAGVLAGVAAVSALGAVLWSAGLIGPSAEERMRFAMNDPAARAAMTRAVVAQLIAEANGQTPSDGALQAISALQDSQAPAEQSAFASLRAGETERAVQTLENFGEDLRQRGQNREAAAAFERASQLATLVAPERALALARRAAAADPDSRAALERTVVLMLPLEGLDATREFLEGVVARESEASPLRVMARLYLAQIAMSTGNGAQADRELANAERDAQRMPQDSFLQASVLTVRSTKALTQHRLLEARRDIIAARQMFARIPGEANRAEAHYMGVLYASGDFEGVWREGRLFLEERERRGWPPSMVLLIQVCQAGLHLRHVATAAPICGAAGRVAVNPNAAAQQRASLALAERRLAEARVEMDALARAPENAAGPDDALALEALEVEHLFRSGEFSAAESRLERLLRMAGDYPTPAMTRAEALRAFGWLELEAGRVAPGCSLLARSSEQYRSFGGDPGVIAVQRLMRDASCPA